MISKEAYERLRATRNDINRLMFGWKKNDQEQFQEGKIAIKVISRLIRKYEEEAAKSRETKRLEFLASLSFNNFSEPK